MNPNFPVYIISKGRWKSRLTAKALERMGVPFHIVVEAAEYDAYAGVIPAHKILVLPESYLLDYETCDDLPADTIKGPGAARNFCWDDAVRRGYSHHWVMDDNIAAFVRLNRNLQVKVTSGTIFRCAEDFVLRYSNVALSGLQYDFFAKDRCVLPPYILNTRIYSCLLIRNDIPFRWRSRYNDDTDLCLRVLKAGWCTVLFQAFLQEKATTMTVKGGNVEIYQGEGRRLMAETLARLHPDVARVVWKFGRWHHSVDYRSFKQTALCRKPDVRLSRAVNNYGMRLVDVSGDGNHSA